MSSTTRTFVAIPVPTTLDLKLSRLQAQLAGEAPEGNWVVTPPFHITLAFLGDVHISDLKPVCLAVAEAAGPFHRFELKLESPSAFPTPERPRVAWLAVAGAELETLAALQRAVAEAVGKVNYPAESRPFHAHVTLGRFSPGRKAAQDRTALFNHYKTWHAGPFTASEVVVFSSSETRQGNAYVPLGHTSLRGIAQARGERGPTNR